MSKNVKKVNPYEKKKKRSLKISRKQWIAIISVLSVAALIAGIVVAVNLGSNGGHYDGDGHDHGTASTDGHYEGDGHDHGSSSGNNSSDDSHGNTSADTVKYQIYTNEDETYRLVIRDGKNEILFEQDKLAKQPTKETIDEEKGVYELGWATGSGANEFECVYYNVKTGQVSDKFVAPRGCDGTRIAYGSADQKKVIVQDLFDKDVYYKEHELENAIEKNGDIIIGGRLHENKKTVVIAYNSSETETNAHTTVELYE